MDDVAPPSLKVVIPSDPQRVAAARRAVASYARDLGCADVHAIELAVSEAITNAVVHAFDGHGGGTITIEARPDTAGLAVSVTDDGRGMTPRPDSPGVGLGLPLIAQLTDGFSIRSGKGDRGTRVSMHFGSLAA